ncbi:hypothetical protein F9L07_26085 [Pimelobacter simplex]|uniref:Fibronectin type-III domain-containing protein n=2 Tax=Nocardioides simplex TaxID=2045 RepID=A0A7J5DRY9_NOCSI|nr:hypothetical protein F9L07_26085 [Pimelobacter simplex]
MRRWMLAVLVAALVVTANAVPPVAAAAAPATDPVRILILGDSVSQGSSGDWTWRYRLWRRLVDAGVAFDLVGPRDDLWDLRADAPGAMSYADPDFDRDHAARWGMFAGMPDVPVATLVTTYQPDVVVVMLGINDLIWTDQPPAEVAARVGDLVTAARSTRPDVDVVLSEVTQHWFPDAPELNAQLAVLAQAATTASSRVVLAAAAAGYDVDRDTWDTSHPNARGEVRIATAVAAALHELGIGPPATLPATMPPVGPRFPAAFSGTLAGAEGRLAWTSGPGATHQLLWRRDVTTGAPWTRSPVPLPRDGTLVVPGLRRHHRYDFRLQPVKGDDLPGGDVYSAVVSLVPGGPVLAPAGVRAVARGRRCVRLAWRPVPDATSYVVERRVGRTWTRPVRTTTPSWRGTRLPVAPRWTFRVRATGDQVVGPPTSVTVRPARSAAPCR